MVPEHVYVNILYVYIMFYNEKIGGSELLKTTTSNSNIQLPSAHCRQNAKPVGQQIVSEPCPTTHTHAQRANTEQTQSKYTENTRTLRAMQQQPLPCGMGHSCVELNQNATEQTIRAWRIVLFPSTVNNTHTHTHTERERELWLIYYQHSIPDQPDKPLLI